MVTHRTRMGSIVGGLLLLGVGARAQLVPETEDQKLLATAPSQSTFLGESLAAEGDRLVVGALADHASYGNQGSVRAFHWIESGWVETDKLVAADGGAFDGFGEDVSLAGDTLIVGAPWHDTLTKVNQGMASAFRWQGAGWVEEQSLLPSRVDVNQGYGRLVATSGGRAFVYGGFDDSPGLPNQEALFVFRRTASGWVEESPIILDGAANSIAYGRSLAASGDRVAFGSAFADVDGAVDQGAVSVFELANGEWQLQATLVADDGEADDRFGWSVALSGDRLAVGAHLHDATPGGNEGAVYVFRRHGGLWTPEPVIALGAAPVALLGSSIALAGSFLVAGAERTDQPIGAAVVQHWNGTAWLPALLLAPSDPDPGDVLGLDVTLTGTMVVAGDPNHTVEPFLFGNQGAAYAFDVLPPGWSFRGGSVAGAGGHPILSATGELDGGDGVTLRLEQAAPAAPTLVVIGLSALHAPFKGGVLVPHPDVLVTGMLSDAQGVLSLSAPWPTLPPGTTLYFQHWIADGATPAGLAASNGVAALVP